MKSLHLTKPHLIVVVGVPGAGKTHFAKQFADTFSAPFLSLEYLSRELDADTKTVNKALEYTLDQVLKTNQSVVYDGDTYARSHRANLAKKARMAGYETLFIWVQTEPNTALNRSTRKSRHDKDRIPHTASEHKRLLDKFTQPKEDERALVISGKHTFATQARIVLERLSKPRAEESKKSGLKIPTRASIKNISPERSKPTGRNISIQ